MDSPDVRDKILRIVRLVRGVEPEWLAHLVDHDHENIGILKDGNAIRVVGRLGSAGPVDGHHGAGRVGRRNCRRRDGRCFPFRAEVADGGADSSCSPETR